MGLLRGFKGLLGFHTVLPVGMDQDLEEVAKYGWLLPLLGFLLALLAGVFGEITSRLLPGGVAAALALFALLYLSGFHDLDGLLDFGDALMYRGTVERRREIMHDVNTGVGGFALGFFVLLITYLGLAAVSTRSPHALALLPALLVAEASAKYAILPMAYAGKASHEGMGSAYVKALGGRKGALLLGTALYLAILVIVTPGRAALLFLATLATSLATTRLAANTVGGVSGDIFGAVNEVARMVAVLVLLV